MDPVLAAFGLCWMCAAALLGLSLGVRHDAWLGKLAALAENGRLLEYHREFIDYRSRVTVHAHAFLFSVVCVAVSVVPKGPTFGPRLADALAWTFIAGTVTWSIGAMARFRPLMALGDFAFLAALLATAFGLLRGLPWP